MKTLTLDKPSTYFRSTVARGIAKDEKAIDRSGGKHEAGLIRGFSMISRGEALGHGLWVDAVMLEQVADHTKKASNGIKSRFTHPSLSGDGLGKMSARTFAARVDGDLVRADAHLLQSAHDAPDGDLASYIMDLAEEDPEAFGASISFTRDIEAERDFLRKHGAKQVDPEVDDYHYFDGRAWNLGKFQSPDPLNTKNLPHTRLKSLRAVDFVDSPAANPSGLFHSDPFQMLEGGEALLDYLFGVTPDCPDTNFGVDPSRLKGFLHRWADSRKFQICTSKENEMSGTAPDAPSVTETTKPVETEASSTTNSAVDPAASVVTEASAVPAAKDLADEAIKTLDAMMSAANVDKSKIDTITVATRKASENAEAAARAQVKQFTELFGAEKGTKWFLEGKSLDECKDHHIKDLTAANTEANAKLSAATTGLGEEAPLSGSASGKSSLPEKYLLTCGRNLGVTAAAIDAQAAKLGLIRPSAN